MSRTSVADYSLESDLFLPLFASRSRNFCKPDDVLKEPLDDPRLGEVLYELVVLAFAFLQEIIFVEEIFYSDVGLV